MEATKTVKNNCNQKNTISTELMKKPRKKRKPEERIIVESSNDPNLEIALALSASLAQNKPCETTLDKKSYRHSNFEKQLSLDENEIKQKKDDQIPEIIMPTASCWWKKTSPVSQKQFMASRKGCNKRHGKTKLESITEHERSSKISEEVSKILIGSGRYASGIKLGASNRKVT